MYIEPNTNIKICKGVPLDNTYLNTLWFNDISSQSAYFASKIKYNLTAQSYQRVVKGKMRIEIKSENLYDCNYLCFQNTSFGTKWFYAFILNVEYVNNVTSEITFEIDVMQTYLFDATLKSCFVEREHSLTDNIGDNLIPENLDTGDYISDDFDSAGIGQKSIVVASTFDKNYNETAYSYYGGIYSGLQFNVFENTANGALEAGKFIDGAGSKSSGIVAVFLMPTKFITENLESVKTFEFSKEKNISNMFGSGGYQIKNNKLYTFPYNYLQVSDLQGTDVVYKYEYFSTEDCEFITSGDMTCDPHVILAPKNYKNIPVNYDEKITLGGYPQCAYNTDSFKEYMGANGINIGLGLIAASSRVSMANINAIGNTSASAFKSSNEAGIGGVLGIANTLGSAFPYALNPEKSHGLGGSSTLAALGLLDFAFMHKHIREEFAIIIDQYFDMFGYATHRVKIPNRNSRPHWNYVKTKNCIIIGNCPSDDIKKMCSIYDSGITFWKNGNEVGNYELDNRP